MLRFAMQADLPDVKIASYFCKLLEKHYTETCHESFSRHLFPKISRKSRLEGAIFYFHQSRYRLSPCCYDVIL